MTMRILVPVDGSASSRAAVRFLAGRETMLGQNPETGMSFDYKNLHVEITRADETCVEEVRVTVGAPQKEEEE